MLGDRRRINRLLKQNRRRSPERRTSAGSKGAPGGKERRERLRRFADRIKSD